MPHSAPPTKREYSQQPAFSYLLASFAAQLPPELARAVSETPELLEPSTRSRHENSALAVLVVYDTELSLLVGYGGWECLESAI